MKFFFPGQKFQNIAQKRAFLSDCPGEQKIMRLVKSAAGLFILAAAAYHLIYEGRKFTITQKRLQLISLR